MMTTTRAAIQPARMMLASLEIRKRLVNPPLLVAPPLLDVKLDSLSLKPFSF